MCVCAFVCLFLNVEPVVILVSCVCVRCACGNRRAKRPDPKRCCTVCVLWGAACMFACVFGVRVYCARVRVCASALCVCGYACVCVCVCVRVNAFVCVRV